MSLDEACSRAIEIANKEGLRGRKVDVLLVPPYTGTGSWSFVVIPIPRTTASQAW